MLRLDPSAAVLTSTHLLLVKLCLQAKAYSYALPILNKHICHFPDLPERSSSEPSAICVGPGSSLSFITGVSGFSAKLTYQDYLRYFVYGGMIYMTLKEWQSALHFLGVVISMPTANSVSAIMVEAYKKWVLVGLLEKGKVSSTYRQKKGNIGWSMCLCMGSPGTNFNELMHVTASYAPRRISRRPT